MKPKHIIMLIVSAAGLMAASSFAIADETQTRKQQPTIEQIDLREEIASPTAGEFSQSGSEFRTGWQQDFGGISGTANGMDSFPTASGEPSAYPAPGGFPNQ